MATIQFQHIILMGRPSVPGMGETLQNIVQALQALHCRISIEAKTAEALSTEIHLPVVSSDAFPNNSDLIIVVGGDGSLLQAAYMGARQGLPVLGINRGKLGFLTDIYPDETEKIKSVLKGHYQAEKRFLLNMAIYDTNDENVLYESQALNDVVLMPGATPQLIEFETFINGSIVCTQRADGLIIATPTGSTAYSLSGGGPILHPHLNAIVLVPMFPHTLSSRPIVVSGDANIQIRISTNNDTPPYLSGDGREKISIPLGGHVTITKYSKPLQLIHPEDYGYFKTLREKLGWERRPGAA